jgi:hypothetical protein
VTEHDEQAVIFRWARLQEAVYPELRMLHAIPNGGKRDKAVAARLRDEGVKPGVPDICLPVPRGAYHALYIELKRRAIKGIQRAGAPTDAQRAWQAELTIYGNKACICYGADEAIEAIKQYLSLPCRKIGCCSEL